MNGTDIYPPMKALYRVKLDGDYEAHFYADSPIEAADEARWQFFSDCDYEPVVNHVERIETVEDLVRD